MSLYQSIFRRKSCRKYDMTALEPAFFEEMNRAIEGFDQLYGDAPLTYRLSTKVKGQYHVAAPHYLVISGSGKAGEQANAGFVFEQLCLWLDQKEIGCVWLGASKDASGGKESDDLIILALGKTTEPVHREAAGFKRKEIATITNAPEDACMQAVHVAPSGMNVQPWYFEKQADRVLVYQEKLNPPISLLYKHAPLDVGIALCHYSLACKEQGRAFRFLPGGDLPAKAGYIPFGIIR